MCNPKSTRKQRPIALFPLGQIVATPGALEALDHAAINAADLIRRHQSGDWDNGHPVMQKKTCVRLNTAGASYRVTPSVKIRISGSSPKQIAASPLCYYQKSIETFFSDLALAQYNKLFPGVIGAK